MVDIALHANDHDILIKDGDFLLIDNAERVAQQIKVKLLTFLGEWFLDTTWGVPYLEYILVKQPNQELIKQILSEQISSVDDVKSLNALELDYQVKIRTLIVNYEVSTEYGLITRKEVLGYGDK
ncbi:hypothetical protein [uncultured Phascolarctobacterium sp.]|jgi:hypothetical protein|uniref:Baseplate wedge protein n=1 Tax=Myoviridae sp. ct9dX1 TaxID=2827665 RepID=A0A8S5TIB8_9CAUD|nr:hypothetical protein [uncultured Phascolarctobacterium sp.]DAF63030.1 MAG TPA: Baseplate wedge protein [Myoviridae sp. ct9dX1]